MPTAENNVEGSVAVKEEDSLQDTRENLKLTHEAYVEGNSEEPIFINTISVGNTAGLSGIIEALQTLRNEVAEKLAN